MPFVAATDRRVAHALHALSLARPSHDLASGYPREDARLRVALGVAPASAIALGDVAATADALTLDHDLSADAAWFDTRWAAGEAEAMSSHADRLAHEANAVAHGGLLPADTAITTLASPTLGRAPVAVTAPWCVVANPRAPAFALVIATVAARLAPALPALDLERAEADLLRALLAAAALERALGGEGSLEAWLPTIAATWLPAPSDAAAFAQSIHRIARRALDQPPGEVDRVATGLAARRISRLQRSLRRAFFAPRGFDLDAWLAGPGQIPA
jgi:hypothetical protein